jgi:hypothetical protein
MARKGPGGRIPGMGWDAQRPAGDGLGVIARREQQKTS